VKVFPLGYTCIVNGTNALTMSDIFRASAVRSLISGVRRTEQTPSNLDAAVGHNFEGGQWDACLLSLPAVLTDLPKIDLARDCRGGQRRSISTEPAEEQ
jgi:hypothetical protein